MGTGFFNNLNELIPISLLIQKLSGRTFILCCVVRTMTVNVGTHQVWCFSDLFNYINQSNIYCG
jgi:hypothetical protein